MGNSQVAGDVPATTLDGTTIKMNLELVVIAVSDVDRAKCFYSKLGWNCDIDHTAGRNIRIVQFTPPGSDSSIMFGANISTVQPGSTQGLHLSVANVEAARNELLRRGVEVSELFHDDGGIFHRAGPEGRAGGPNPERKSYASYASFSDPDGNGFVLQEICARLASDLKAGDTRFTPELVNAALGLAPGA
jgi:predicted enzyme related to lactoylglutathione lyase